MYLIRLRLTNNVIFNLYHILLLPIKVRGIDSKFVFIQPEHDYLLMDTAKRYFTWLRVDEIRECRAINKVLKICKKTQPVQLTHLDEVCEAQMIEPIRSILVSCSKRIVDLNHTLWTQLDGNGWFFVTPASDVLAALCSKHEPMDVKLLGTGKLS